MSDSPARSVKKGVGTWYFDGVERALADVQARWYYTWSTKPADDGTSVKARFVPMIWGADATEPETVQEAAKHGRVLLGFNEPDRTDQANLSVEQALDLWPRLMTTGQRLGSPAPAAHAPDEGAWLARFLAGAAARGYRVDFITLHWYGTDFDSGRAVAQLRAYLEATHDRYGLPIWLTEYALTDFSGHPRYPTPAQQAAFVMASTAMLERLPYVERYAWFALPSNGTDADTGLYLKGATATGVGAAYRRAGPRC